jgi:hypothetical protein
MVGGSGIKEKERKGASKIYCKHLCKWHSILPEQYYNNNNKKYLKCTHRNTCIYSWTQTHKAGAKVLDCHSDQRVPNLFYKFGVSNHSTP